jgi:uncharacterized membrane protein YphA (DoxX/SURF4 family)
MKNLIKIIRIFSGLVFMLSGFVKGVDPLGTAYRFEDYFIVYHLPWLMPLALTVSVTLCTVEFVLGAMLFFNLRTRFTAWVLLLMMSFFTVLTFYDALTNLVPDCGCFGDALKLTNWQTFYKNVLLIIFAVLIFAYRRRQDSSLPVKRQWNLTIVISIIFIYFSVYCYQHLPVIDFTEWKQGNKLFVENPLPQKFFLTYRNKKTGEQKEYRSPDYPYTDSLWMAQWKFVSQRVEDPNVYFGRNLQISDSAGVNLTDQYIRDPGFVFLMTSSDLRKAHEHSLVAMNRFAEQVKAGGGSFIFLVSNTPDEVNQLRQKIRLTYPVYYADDIVLKTMVRSNPGLMLLHHGVIVKKWHYRDFPDYEKIAVRYFVKHKKLNQS